MINCVESERFALVTSRLSIHFIIPLQMLNYSGYDPWIREPTTVNKFSALMTYTVLNYLAVPLGIFRIVSILRLDKISVTNIFVLELMAGCLMMSIPCATICAMTYHNNGYFGGGAIGCQAEAFAHVSAIIIQFQSIMMIGWSNWMSVHQQKVKRSFACKIVALQVFVAELGTATFAYISQMYLMPVGAYCFYNFTSPVILLWFSPVMLVTLGFTIYFYRDIYIIAKSASKYAQSNISATKAASRSSIFIAAYFFGWFPAVITAVYALIYGAPTEELDTTLAVFGSLHSVWQPLTYMVFDQSLPVILITWCECWMICFTGWKRIVEDGKIKVVRASTNQQEENTSPTRVTIGSTFTSMQNRIPTAIATPTGPDRPIVIANKWIPPV